MDIYMSVDDDTRGDLKLLKNAVMMHAGGARPLISWPTIYGTSSASQWENQWLCVGSEKAIHRIIPFRSYDCYNVLWQVCHHLFVISYFWSNRLHWMMPLKVRMMEYALTFHPSPENVDEVNVIQRKSSPQQKAQGLEAVLEGVTKHLKALELKLESSKASQHEPPKAFQQVQYWQPRPPRQRYCWICGDSGHFQRDCPLNESRPARKGGWPRP